MSERLVVVYRGGLVESFHTGSIAVVDTFGRLLAYCGDPGAQTFIRSAAKPFQTIPMLLEGAGDEFDLTSEEIALITASHGGEPHHVAAAASILRKGDFDEEDLLCGSHVPYDEKAAAELRAAGELPSPLHNNCSGKHAGMLLASKLLDATSSPYTAPDHPVQVEIEKSVADFAGLSPGEIGMATDGCGVPSFFMSIHRAALAYARLGATALDSPPPAGLPRYSESARQVVDAMLAHPEYVAGNWSITTALMEAVPRQLVTKDGAEGFYAMLILPPLADELHDRCATGSRGPIGIAMKIHDGSMARGRNPAILATLRALGIDLSDRPAIAPHLDGAIRNAAGVVVGEVRAELDLKLL
ncbi:MAG TPA: asparaginase [Thermoanaerobaculia bacterium]|nr:asparaginase [Thermoanaerobaculia bacterium]